MINEKAVLLLEQIIKAKYKNVKCPIFLVVNKIETTTFEKMYPVLAKLNEFEFVKKFITALLKVVTVLRQYMFLRIKWIFSNSVFRPTCIGLLWKRDLICRSKIIL